MSISERPLTLSQPTVATTGTDGLAGLATHWIDPAMIAHMANELFTALPRHLSPPPGASLASAPPATPPTEVGALALAPAVPPSSAVGPPGEIELRSLPATVSDFTPRPPQAGLTPSAFAGPDFGAASHPDALFGPFPNSATAAPPMTAPVEAGLLSVAPREPAYAAPSAAELHALPTALAQPLPPLARPPSATASGDARSFYFLDAVTTPVARASEPVFPTASAPYFLDAGLTEATVAQSPTPTPVPALPATAGPLAPFEFLELRAERTPDLALVPRPFDPRAIRRDFPILQERVHGRPLIWLDNAATTQKPNAVIDRLSEFYRRENSNIHRAAHTLAARATDAYEAAREAVRRFLNAPSINEIVFVRGTTEGINLVAQSWGRRHVEQDDEIVITWLEHHANIVPWQQLCAEKGARLRVAPVDDHGQVILEEYEKLLGPRTRLVAFSQVSNALGTVTPAREMVEIAHRYGARVLVDGAQAVSHMAVDVQALDCDWYVFSGHKVFGPTGIGAVFGKEELLNTTPPWQGGGNMIADVTFDKTIYQPAPTRFEAGTGNIADAVGLGAALDYLAQIGMENVSRYEHELLVYATAALAEIPGLRLIGTAREKAGVLSFVLDGFRSEDVGKALDLEGIAVRSGHHCAQPILRRFGLESTVRPSLALYNLREEIDALVAALRRIQVDPSRRAV